MTGLLELPPYGIRDEERFLEEMRDLNEHHFRGCKNFRAIFRDCVPESVQEMPFLHVGAFKSISLRTEAEGIDHQRTLHSSATSSGKSSIIALDAANKMPITIG